METRQTRDDVLDDSVCKIFLFRIAAQVGEGQHRNRGFRDRSQRPWFTYRRCYVGGGACFISKPFPWGPLRRPPRPRSPFLGPVGEALPLRPPPHPRLALHRVPAQPVIAPCP